MRTQVEWNVETQTPRVPPPRMRSTRSRISRAALLVNVTARISCGRAAALAIRCATRCVSMRVFPLPAPASTSSGPSTWRTASACSGFSPAVISSGAGTRGTLAQRGPVRLPRHAGQTRLLDGDRLGQVARLVDVGAFQRGDVVGEHLQRDVREQRGHRLAPGPAHADPFVRLALHSAVV